MSEVSQVEQFIKFWFDHSACPDNIRIICLPSDFLIKNLKAAGRKAPIEEFPIRRELWAVGAEQYTEKLVAFNQRGYDVFYFVNWVGADCPGNATNADVFKRLHFPLDLDFRLPVTLGDLESELGLTFAAIIQSSKREWERHQLLVACEAIDGIEGRDLAREFCAATGSDGVSDAKRILRLPGLINWKGAAGDVAKASRCSLIRAEKGHELSADEILAQVCKFADNKMSADLRSLRMVRTRDGGLCQGEKGEYGRWDKALESAEKGQWTAAKGSRHNALLSWGYQMSAARLTWESTERNWRFLAEKGCETPPDDDPRDFELLLRDVRKGWEKIDAELDELMSATDSDGFADEGADESTVELESITTRTEASEGEHGRTLKTERPFNYTLEYFAAQVAARFIDEPEANYLKFLSECLAGANFFNRIEQGDIRALCNPIQRRLEWAGCLKGGDYYCPIEIEFGERYYCTITLNEQQTRLFVRHVLFEVSRKVVQYRSKLEPPKLDPTLKKKKNGSKTVFAAKGELLSQYERDMILRRANETVLPAHVFGGAFQGGYFNAALHDGNGCQAPSIWIPNRSRKQGESGLDRNVSWLRFPRVNAAHILTDELSRVSHLGTAQLIESLQERAPLFAKFCSDAFPGDSEAIRGLLLVLAYCFQSMNPYQKWFFFEGVPGGGKGTFSELILNLAGKGHNAGKVNIESLRKDSWLGPFQNRTVLVIDEAESEDAWLRKKVFTELARLTGSDFVSSRRLYEDDKNIFVGQKFILVANKQMDVEDTSERQKRRVVPVYFGYKPRGKIIEDLHMRLFMEEGNLIATYAMAEFVRNLQHGPDMFNRIESDAFTIGKARFQEATTQVPEFLREILKECPEGECFPSEVLAELGKVWVESSEERSHLARGIEKRIVGDAKIQFPHAYRNRISPLPGEGQNRRRGFVGLRVDCNALVNSLDMTPREIIRKLHQATREKERLWGAIRLCLDFSPEEYSAALGESGAQTDLFERGF